MNTTEYKKIYVMKKIIYQSILMVDWKFYCIMSTFAYHIF